MSQSSNPVPTPTSTQVPYATSASPEALYLTQGIDASFIRRDVRKNPRDPRPRPKFTGLRTTVVQTKKAETCHSACTSKSVIEIEELPSFLAQSETELMETVFKKLPPKALQEALRQSTYLGQGAHEHNTTHNTPRISRIDKYNAKFITREKFITPFQGQFLDVTTAVTALATTLTGVAISYGAYRCTQAVESLSRNLAGSAQEAAASTTDVAASARILSANTTAFTVNTQATLEDFATHTNQMTAELRDSIVASLGPFGDIFNAMRDQLKPEFVGGILSILRTMAGIYAICRTDDNTTRIIIIGMLSTDLIRLGYHAFNIGTDNALFKIANQLMQRLKFEGFRGHGDGIDHTIMDAMKTLCNALAGVFGTKVVNHEPNFKSVQYLRTLIGGVKDVGSVLKFIYSFFTETVVHMYFSLTGKVLNLPGADALVEEALRWIAKVRELIVLDMNPRLTCLKSPEKGREILALEREGSELSSRLIRHNLKDSNFHEFFDTLRMLKDFTAIAKSSLANGEGRNRPVFVALVGKPGKGKSTAIEYIEHDVFQLLHKHYPDLFPPWNQFDVYNKKAGSVSDMNYDEGYINQTRARIDDFGSQSDSEIGCSICDWIIHTVNDAPCPLTMASLNAKGCTFFNSKMVTLTSNQDPLQKPKGLTDFDAVLSRIDCYYSVNFAGKYFSTNDQQRGPAVPPPPGTDPRTLWDFKCLKSNSNKKYHEVIADIVEAFIKHQIKKKTVVRDLMDEDMGPGAFSQRPGFDKIFGGQAGEEPIELSEEDKENIELYGITGKESIYVGTPEYVGKATFAELPCDGETKSLPNIDAKSLLTFPIYEKDHAAVEITGTPVKLKNYMDTLINDEMSLSRQIEYCTNQLAQHNEFADKVDFIRYKNAKEFFHGRPHRQQAPPDTFGCASNVFKRCQHNHSWNVVLDDIRVVSDVMATHPKLDAFPPRGWKVEDLDDPEFQKVLLDILLTTPRSTHDAHKLAIDLHKNFVATCDNFFGIMCTHGSFDHRTQYLWMAISEKAIAEYQKAPLIWRVAVAAITQFFRELKSCAELMGAHLPSKASFFQNVADVVSSSFTVFACFILLSTLFSALFWFLTPVEKKIKKSKSTGQSKIIRKGSKQAQKVSHSHKFQKFQGQSFGRDPNTHEIVQRRVEPNLHTATCKAPGAPNQSRFNVLFVKSNLAVMVKHTVSDLFESQDAILSIYTTDRTYHYAARELEIYEDEDYDLVFIRFPSKGAKRMIDHKDLTSLFITEADIPDDLHDSLAMVYCSPEQKYILSHSSGSNMNPHTYHANGLQISNPRGFEVKIHNQPGFCGSAYVAYDTNYPRKIFGIHSAGNTVHGIGIFVTQEMIADVASAYEGHVSQEDIEWATGDEAAQVLIDKYALRDEEGNVVKTNDLGLENMEIICKVKPQFAHYPSREVDIAPSLLYNVIHPPTSYPVNLVHQPDGSDSFKACLKKGDVPVKKLDLDTILECEFIYESILHDRDLLMPPNVMNEFEAINGVPHFGFESLNFNTAEGWPTKPILGHLKGNTKGKHYLFDLNSSAANDMTRRPTPEFQVLLQELTDDLENDKPHPIVYTFNMKAETRMKPTPRSIFASDAAYIIKARQYNGAYIINVMANHNYKSCAVGINPHSLEWDLLYRFLRPSPEWKVLCTDISNNDNTMPRELLNLTRWNIHHWYKDYVMAFIDHAEEQIGIDPDVTQEMVDQKRDVIKKQSQARWKLNGASCSSFRLIKDTLVRCRGKNSSGTLLTTMANSDASECLIRFAIQRLLATTEYKSLTYDEVKDRFLRIKNFGDDIICGIAPEIQEFVSIKKISDICLEFFGMLITHSAKGDPNLWPQFDDWETAEFLKRRFVKDENGYYHGALPKAVIYDMINWIKPKLGASKATAQNCEAALLEAFHWGRAFFNELTILIKENAPKHNVGQIRYYSYNNLMAKFTEGSGLAPLMDKTNVYYGQSYSIHPDLFEHNTTYDARAHAWYEEQDEEIQVDMSSDIDDFELNLEEKPFEGQSAQEPADPFDSDQDLPSEEEDIWSDNDWVPPDDYEYDYDGEDMYDSDGEFIQAKADAEFAKYSAKNYRHDSTPNPYHKLPLEEGFLRFRNQYPFGPQWTPPKPPPFVGQSGKEEDVMLDSEVLVVNAETDELQTFADITPTVMQSVISKSSAYGKSDPYPHRELTDILSRPISVPITWSSSDVPGTLLARFNFPELILTTNNFTRAVLNQFQYFRSPTRVEFRGNSNIFNKGTLIIVWQSHVPNVLPTTLANTHNASRDDFRLAYAVQMPHVLLSASNQKTVGFTIPYVSPSAYWNAAHTESVAGKFGTIEVYVYNQLMNTETVTTSVAISMVASFSQPEVAGPTVGYIATTAPPFKGQGKKETQAEEAKKVVTTGVLSNGLATISRVSAALFTIPTIGPIAAAASPVLKVMSKIAASYGWDKPTLPTNPNKVMIDMSENMAFGVGSDSSEKLAITPYNTVASEVSIFGDSVDFSQFDNYKRRPGLVCKLAYVPGSQTVGYIFCTIPVCPTYTLTRRSYIVDPSDGIFSDIAYNMSTPSSFLASQFEYWTGSMNYCIFICCAKTVTGKIRITWLPDHEFIPTTGLDQGAANFISTVIDFAGDTMYRFNIPYLQQNDWLKTVPADIFAPYGNISARYYTQCTNGVVQVSLANEISYSGDASSAEIDISVLSSCGPDMRFACQRTLWNKYWYSRDWATPTELRFVEPVAPAYEGQSGLEEVDFHALFQGEFETLIPGTSVQIKTGLEHGEEVDNFHTLSHRYEPMKNVGVFNSTYNFKYSNATIMDTYKASNTAPLDIIETARAQGVYPHKSFQIALVRAFQWHRGSVRYKLTQLTGAGNLIGFSISRPRSLETLDDDGDASHNQFLDKIPGVTGEINAIAMPQVLTSGFQYGGNWTGPMTMFDFSKRNMASVEMPFYTARPFKPTEVHWSGDIQGESQLFIFNPIYADTPTNKLFLVFAAMGDDVSRGFPLVPDMVVGYASDDSKVNKATTKLMESNNNSRSMSPPVYGATRYKV